MEKVLIVDDDRDLRSIVGDVLKEEGFSTVEAADGPGALASFKNDVPDAVLLDLQMPGISGIETMQQLRKTDPSVPVIILTGYGDIPTAVECIKAGAYDFVIKPPEFEKLVVTIKRAVERRRLEMDMQQINSALGSSLEQLVGKSPSVQPLIKQIRNVAQTDFSVLIQGETGTGKSVVAGAIKNLSRRSHGPFVCVDIGLIPDTLVESELFGFKKGAFSGADKDKVGYFEAAHTGTIFIDELENMSPHVQAKLLRVIESKKICPLGTTMQVDVDVRVIGATNMDIRESVRKKLLREDLFYRLGEFIITVPPLRERREDIALFAGKFMLEASAELNKQIRGISDKAIAALADYPWPGNIRELKNAIRRSVLLAETDWIDRISIEQSSMEQPAGIEDCSLSLKDSLRHLEKQKIRAALKKSGGQKKEAARILGISYKSMIEKTKEYGIE